jgi:hypothetical protein
VCATRNGCTLLFGGQIFRVYTAGSTAERRNRTPGRISRAPTEQTPESKPVTPSQHRKPSTSHFCILLTVKDSAPPFHALVSGDSLFFSLLCRAAAADVDGVFVASELCLYIRLPTDPFSVPQPKPPVARSSRTEREREADVG